MDRAANKTHYINTLLGQQVDELFISRDLVDTSKQQSNKLTAYV